jgi:hypothetical protein
MVKTSINKFAFMAQRKSKKSEPDFFPTPPWATRALLESFDKSLMAKQTVSESACGKGHMSNVLQEYFEEVHSADINDYGYGAVQDFLGDDVCAEYDWIITNPPFKNAEEFILRALERARVGVAMLARTQLLEGKKRYENVYSKHPPYSINQFVERVPMVKNRLDRKASTATSYAWFVWRKDILRSYPDTDMKWIAPCRKQLERDSDYSE